MFVSAIHKPKFGQTGIILEHPLTPYWYMLFNESSGNGAFSNLLYLPDNGNNSGFWAGDYIDLTASDAGLSGEGFDWVIGTGNYTLFVMLASTATEDYNSIITFNGYDPQWFFNADGQLAVYDGGLVDGYGTVAINDGAFHGIAFVRRGTGANEVDLYVDGIFDTTITHAYSIDAVTNIRINQSSLGEYGLAKYKCIFLYPRALSGAEIASLSANPWQWTYNKSEMLIRSIWAVAGGGTAVPFGGLYGKALSGSLGGRGV